MPYWNVLEIRDAVLAQQGDLVSDRQFVGSDRALVGLRGHQKIQRSRPAGYQKEVPVENHVEDDEFILQIRGRIDGVLATPIEVLLEEIKTVQGAWDHMADPLHWAQAKIYGFIYANQQALNELSIQLTYLELETGKVTELRQKFLFVELANFFNVTTARYADARAPSTKGACAAAGSQTGLGTFRRASTSRSQCTPWTGIQRW